MTPLNGLNLVYPQPFASSSNDLLESPPSLPDMSSQLAMWANLAFDSEEPTTFRHDDAFPNYEDTRSSSDAHTPNERAAKYPHGENGWRRPSLQSDVTYWAATAVRDGHQNVVTGRDISPQANQHAELDQTPLDYLPHPSSSLQGQLSDFNVDAFLAGFTPSSSVNDAARPQSDIPTTPTTDTEHRTAKRARLSDITSPASSRSSVPTVMDKDDLAEDKRRRNTAASARFRQKKKEREAAMESRTKSLEGKLENLERECDGLRRENGWLRGIVAGVAGANTSSETKRKHSEVEA